ncbi:MAG: Coq4 family protein [Myxococcota bacterium]|nr:Coq4 family protein [Myxococcota bacterium]
MPEPLVDREFAEKFFRSVDRPLDYGVYFLFHEWWDKAPQDAIDAYAEELRGLDGAAGFLEARHLAEPLSLDRLSRCAEGTLGHGYYRFIVDNDLEANLARNYKTFNEELAASGKLDRLPDDLSYAIVRGFQIHDFLHVLTGFDSTPMGELSQAAFHFAQLRYPYHAMRVAVVTSYMAFLDPKIITEAMDAMVAGWSLGRACQNLHFERWEDQLDTPIAAIRERVGITRTAQAA